MNRRPRAASASRYEVRLTAMQPEEITAMQAALRSLIAPPKPEEPTGLGAVVEDAEGERWVRIGDGAWWRRPFDEAGRTRNALYADIAAVKVLSEGVTS